MLHCGVLLFTFPVTTFNPFSWFSAMNSVDTLDAPYSFSWFGGTIPFVIPPPMQTLRFQHFPLACSSFCYVNTCSLNIRKRGNWKCWCMFTSLGVNPINCSLSLSLRGAGHFPGILNWSVTSRMVLRLLQGFMSFMICPRPWSSDHQGF